MKIGTTKGKKNLSTQLSAKKAENKPVEASLDPYLLNSEFTSPADHLIQQLHNYHTNIKGDSHDRETVLREAIKILETRA